MGEAVLGGRGSILVLDLYSIDQKVPERLEIMCSWAFSRIVLWSGNKLKKLPETPA